jgi:hypothetical protein
MDSVPPIPSATTSMQKKNPVHTSWWATAAMATGMTIKKPNSSMNGPRSTSVPALQPAIGCGGTPPSYLVIPLVPIDFPSRATSWGITADCASGRD